MRKQIRGYGQSWGVIFVWLPSLRGAKRRGGGSSQKVSGFSEPPIKDHYATPPPHPHWEVWLNRAPVKILFGSVAKSPLLRTLPTVYSFCRLSSLNTISINFDEILTQI